MERALREDSFQGSWSSSGLERVQIPPIGDLLVQKPRHQRLWPLLILFLFFFSNCADPLHPRPRGPVWVSFSGPAFALRSNHINAILTTRAGQVWIATDSGASFYERGNWGVIVDTLSYYSLGRKQAMVTALTQGRDGSIWFGTNGGGVHRYLQTPQLTGIQWITYREPEISSNIIRSLTCENIVSGDVWVGTALFGANRFIPSSTDPRFGEWKTYSANEVLAFRSNQMSAMAFNTLDYSIWVSSIFNLTVFFNDIVGWREYPSAIAYDYTILAMTFDLSNNLWVGKREGAAKLDRYRDWTYYTNQTTGGRIPGGAVNAVTTNLTNTRWFGTTRGLVRLQDTTWTTFNRANYRDILSDTITSLAYDQYDNLWIGTVNGVNIFNDKGVFLY